MDISSSKIAEEYAYITKALDERLKIHSISKNIAQNKLHEICEGLRKQIDEFEDKISSELEDKSIIEESRFQSALNDLHDIGMDTSIESCSELRQAIQSAKAELLITQSYDIVELGNREQRNGPTCDFYGHYKEPINKKRRIEPKQKVSFSLMNMWDLRVNNKVIPDMLELRKPRDVRVIDTRKDICIQFTHLNLDEFRVLSEYNAMNIFEYKCLLSKKDDDNIKDSKEYTLTKINDYFVFTSTALEVGTTYLIRVKTMLGDRESEWSDSIEFREAEFSGHCLWKKCPRHIDEMKKYSIDEKVPSVVTKFSSNKYSTIPGSTPIPFNKSVSWNINIINSWNNGNGIYVGVAPSDIDQNTDDNYDKCGWYFSCYKSKLHSGPPHNYKRKFYGLVKKEGEYVRTGDSVSIVMDTVNGDLSFILNGINFGVAYEGIPLDKPLVPCVILLHSGDSVELDFSNVKKIEVDNSIPIPSNIVSMSITWNSIALIWGAVDGASFYQVETDDNRICGLSANNTFTKKGLLPESEHSFRVRTVKGNSVSEWSDLVIGKTVKDSFEASGWKECPDDSYKGKYYIYDNNPRIAISIGGHGFYDYCTVTGDTSLPFNKVTSWNIKILKSQLNNGDGIYIGVAPFDIYQNGSYNYNKCGWYFDCYFSSLCSGPPHYYENKKYGPKKEKGRYVCTGDSVGVVMDMIKGKLSFALGGVNYGVAYEGIPIDKPLVPCITLKRAGDAVELDTSGVKENEVDSSILVPSNIVAKSGVMWNSITLTWDAVERASFYQIEVDGSRICGASTTNAFEKNDFLPESEHSFRVRTVKEGKVSEWCSTVKGRTGKVSFESSWWKECPDNVSENRKYSVDEDNSRITTKISDRGYCAIIGNISLPLGRMLSWNIKILKSQGNDGEGIYIGVAPFDINQNEKDNYNKSGWYFDCYHSILCSGPPHNHRSKKYGLKKGKGEYVHTGDSVGVLMNTTKGELSFSLNDVNWGVAYEGIPLDKPLVPCVILKNYGDSVELVT